MQRHEVSPRLDSPQSQECPEAISGGPVPDLDTENPWHVRRRGRGSLHAGHSEGGEGVCCEEGTVLTKGEGRGSLHAGHSEGGEGVCCEEGTVLTKGRGEARPMQDPRRKGKGYVTKGGGEARSMQDTRREKNTDNNNRRSNEKK
jgi:hypothetical protein